MTLTGAASSWFIVENCCWPSSRRCVARLQPKLIDSLICDKILDPPWRTADNCRVQVRDHMDHQKPGKYDRSGTVVYDGQPCIFEEEVKKVVWVPPIRLNTGTDTILKSFIRPSEAQWVSQPCRAALRYYIPALC